MIHPINPIADPIPGSGKVLAKSLPGAPRTRPAAIPFGAAIANTCLSVKRSAGRRHRLTQGGQDLDPRQGLIAGVGGGMQCGGVWRRNPRERPTRAGVMAVQRVRP